MTGKLSEFVTCVGKKLPDGDCCGSCAYMHGYSRGDGGPALDIAGQGEVNTGERADSGTDNQSGSLLHGV